MSGCCVVLSVNDNPDTMQRLIDLSNNNGRAAVSAITDAAVGAVYLKATEGLTFQDDLYPVFRAAAKKAGKPCGAYLFLHPDLDGAAQAHYLLAYAQPKPGDLQPVVDSETTTVAGGYQKAASTTYAALCELEAHGYAPLLYGSTSFLKAIIAIEPRLRRFRVWQAEYGPALHLVPGLNAVAWQLTDRLVVCKGSLRVDGSQLRVRNLVQLEIPTSATVRHPKPQPAKKPKSPTRRRYYTRKKDVPLKPGQILGYTKGKGYYAKPQPRKTGGGGGGSARAA